MEVVWPADYNTQTYRFPALVQYRQNVLRGLQLIICMYNTAADCQVAHQPLSAISSDGSSVTCAQLQGWQFRSRIKCLASGPICHGTREAAAAAAAATGHCA